MRDDDIQRHVREAITEAEDDAAQAFDPAHDSVPEAWDVASAVRREISDTIGLDGPQLEVIVDAYAQAWVGKASEMAHEFAVKEQHHA